MRITTWPSRTERAVGRLGVGSLLTLVDDVAAAAPRWLHRVHHDPVERWYERLHLDPLVEVWILSWCADQATDLHDHGGSDGAFAVVSGTLVETVAEEVAGRVVLSTATLGAGSVRGFSGDHVHDVAHAGGPPAVSVHAYSPPLRTMGFATVEGGRLRRTRTEVMDPRGAPLALL